MGNAHKVAERPRRRTQAQRSRQTRARLLDATIDLIAELGYGAMTVAAVAERAGVSEGGLFRHYPTKAALIAAAAETLYARLLVRLHENARAVEHFEDRLHEVLAIVQRDFRSKELIAATELQLLARRDAELRAVLRPIIDHHWERVIEVFSELFPAGDRSDRERFLGWLDVVLCTFQGAAIAVNVRYSPEEEMRRLKFLEWVSRRALLEE